MIFQIRMAILLLFVNYAIIADINLSLILWIKSRSRSNQFDVWWKILRKIFSIRFLCTCISHAMPHSPAFNNKRHLYVSAVRNVNLIVTYTRSGAYPAGSYRPVRGIVLDFNPSWITGAYKCRLIYDRSDPIRSDRERESARGIHPKIIASRPSAIRHVAIKTTAAYNDLIFSINKLHVLSSLLEDERRGGEVEVVGPYPAETFPKRPQARYVCYACPIKRLRHSSPLL